VVPSELGEELVSLLVRVAGKQWKMEMEICVDMAHMDRGCKLRNNRIAYNSLVCNVRV